VTTAVRSSTLVNAGSGTATNCDTPTGTVAGDVCLVFGHINNNPTWVDNNGANAFTKDYAYEPATNEALHGWSIRPTSGNISGWGGTPDFTSGASTRWSMCMVTISDPDPSVIDDATPVMGQFDATGSTTTVTVNSITATAESLHFIAVGADGNTTVIDTTSVIGAGYTVLQNGGAQALLVAVKQVPAGATGDIVLSSMVPGATQWIAATRLVRMNSSVVIPAGFPRGGDHFRRRIL
jgi:hypothetical protein